MLWSESFILSKFQTDAVVSVLESWTNRIEPARRVLGIAATGAGKCWSTDTPMLLIDGSTKAVQNIQCGDLLIGPDSTPRRVVATNSGSGPMFLLTPHRHAEPMTVNGDHILSLQCTNIGKRRMKLPDGSMVKAGEIVFITVNDWLAASTTAKHCLKWRQCSFQLQAQPCDTLPIPPWLLGFWLADGSSYHATVHKPRSTEWCQEDAAKMGWKCRRMNLQDGKCESATITGGFRVALRGLNLLQNKHIPPAYLRASQEVRSELLAGILDGDGYFNKGGFELTLKDGQLPAHAHLLARSLGFAVTVSDKWVDGRLYRRAYLGGGCHLPTKRHPQRVRRQKKSPLLTGFSVTPVGLGAYHGFTLDGTDRQLLMPDGTVAHNTVICCRILFRAVERGKKCLFLADSEELVGQTVKMLHNTCGIAADIEQASHHASLEADVVVASIQSISKAERLRKFPADHFQVVICDEAHTSLAAGWLRVLKYFGGAKVLGVTATPSRGDRQSLMKKFYEKIAFNIPMFDLIDSGHLVPVKVAEFAINMDLEGIEIEIDEDQKKLAEVMQPLHDEIITAWEERAAERKTLWFHPSRASSRAFADRLVARGHSAKHIDGSSPDRKVILEQFHLNQFRNINNAILLVKGYDEPEISCVVPLRGFKTKTPYIQAIGRGTRLFCPNNCRNYHSCKCEGKKKDLLVLDLFGAYPKLGVMTPADLAGDEPEQVAAMRRAIKAKDGEIDLKDLSLAVAGEREQAFLRDLKQARKYGSKTVYDARHVAIMYGSHELFDFDPSSVGQWGKKKVSDKQRHYLADVGVDPRTIANRAHASAMIQVVVDQRRGNMATVRQIAALDSFGIPHHQTMTIDEARSLIIRNNITL